jgi:hypothetical protein
VVRGWLEAADDEDVLGGKELRWHGSSWKHDDRRLRSRTVACNEAVDGARGRQQLAVAGMAASGGAVRQRARRVTTRAKSDRCA